MSNQGERCTVCGQEGVEYLEHMKIQHHIDQPFSTALRNLQHRIHDLEQEVAAKHGHMEHPNKS